VQDAVVAQHGFVQTTVSAQHGLVHVTTSAVGGIGQTPFGQSSDCGQHFAALSPATAATGVSLSLV